LKPHDVMIKQNYLLFGNFILLSKNAMGIIEINTEIPSQYFLAVEGLANRFDAIPSKITWLLSDCARNS